MVRLVEAARRLAPALLCALLLAPLTGEAMAENTVTRYLRYAHAGETAIGRLEGETIHELRGDLFANPRPTGRTVPLRAVTLLPPTVPSKVLAAGLNYRSHAGEAGAREPGLFAKLPSSLVGHGAPIVIPKDAGRVHYEGELVVVIGKRAKNVSEADAPAHVFGVTAGNDVSARDWQGADLQWLRAKAADSFGPVGPVIAVGLDYSDLKVETRVNGKTVQSESTKMLIHPVARIVSFASRYFTLEPGDLIFTGTPGRTARIAPGDVVEVEVQGVGVLRNPVEAGE